MLTCVTSDGAEVELVTKFAGGCEREEAGLVERAKAILGTLEPSRVDLHESAVPRELAALTAPDRIAKETAYG